MNFLKVNTKDDVSHQLWGSKCTWTTHIWKTLGYPYQNFDAMEQHAKYKGHVIYLLSGFLQMESIKCS
jgi:hypothetical protein